MNNLLFFTTIFFLGFRHGFDFDHIAAISDITGGSKDIKSGALQSFFYIIGHALIVFLLGVLAITIGFSLPEAYISVIEIFVGISLILLGLYLLFSIITRKNSFKLVGRGMILFKIFKRIFKKNHSHAKAESASFLVGVIHGIGAETPSQILLLSLAGAAGQAVGGTGLALFIIGLMLANSIVSLSTLLGYTSFMKHPLIKIIAGSLMAIFSIYVGLGVFM